MAMPSYTTAEHYEKKSNAELIAAFNDLVSKTKDWLGALTAQAKQMPAGARALLDIQGVLGDWNLYIRQRVSDAIDMVTSQGGQTTAMGGVRPTNMGFLPVVIPVVTWLASAAIATLTYAGVRYAVVAACAAMGGWIYRGQQAQQKAKDELAAIEAQKKAAIARAQSQAEVKQVLKEQGFNDTQIAAYLEQMERERQESGMKKMLGIDATTIALIGGGVYLVGKYISKG